MTKIPSLLRKGDKVAVVAPAGKVDKKALESGLSLISSWGLVPVEGKNLFDGYNYFSSTDENRLYDLQWALDDFSIKAIFCARGGYGTSRIIERLNFDNFKKNPKWVIGYSDITILLNKIQRYNIACIHGPMPATFFKYKNSSVKLLRKILFDGNISYRLSKKNSYFFNERHSYSFLPTGGNLTMLCHSIGTNFQLNTKNKVLVIEEINEEPYKIERYFYQLFHSGLLNNVKGLILGNIKLKKQKDFILNVFEKDFVLNLFPDIEFFIHHFPCGHGKLNYPVVMNIPLKIEVKNDYIVFKQEL